MPSTYNISSGEFRDPSGNLVGFCYAGHPPHVNDPSAVDIKNSGPLPPGEYFMYAPITSLKMGPVAIPLIPRPQPGTAPFAWLFGRSGFYIHADLIEWEQHPADASDGCIVPTKQPDGTVNGRAVREAIVEIRKLDSVLQVQRGVAS